MDSDVDLRFLFCGCLCSWCILYKYVLAACQKAQMEKIDAMTSKKYVLDKSVHILPKFYIILHRADSITAGLSLCLNKSRNLASPKMIKRNK